jgi:hypothetical protein
MRGRLALCVIVLTGGGLLALRSHAQTPPLYCGTEDRFPPVLYNIGPNRIDMPGGACLGQTVDAERNLQRFGSRLENNVGTATEFVVCPIPRRSTTFYPTEYLTPENTDTTNRHKIVRVTSISIRGEGSTNTSVPWHMACYAFLRDMATGTTYFGETRYLCAAAGGCVDPPNPVYRNSNTISLPWGLPQVPTMNYGFICELPKNRGGVVSYTVNVDPNP